MQVPIADRISEMANENRERLYRKLDSSKIAHDSGSVVDT